MPGKCSLWPPEGQAACRIKPALPPSQILLKLIPPCMSETNHTILSVRMLKTYSFSSSGTIVCRCELLEIISAKAECSMPHWVRMNKGTPAQMRTKGLQVTPGPRATWEALELSAPTQRIMTEPSCGFPGHQPSRGKLPQCVRSSGPFCSFQKRSSTRVSSRGHISVHVDLS